MTLADNSRQALDGRRFDVAVIGGGINGVAIARECARSGRATLLLEQGDFAAGTTSRSTRMIHGGLRYLEHGEIALVRESLRERARLLRDYPHLVRPVTFLLALGPETRRSALEIRFGLWLYRRFAGDRRNGNAADQVAALERWLDSGYGWTIFHYQDAQCEFPERLVAHWLVEAAQAGAAARNYTEVLEIEVVAGVARRLRLRDRLTGKEARVEAGWIINAAGPWADQVAQRTGRPVPRMIGGVRGSHIVLPNFAGAPRAAIYVEAVDGRPMFVIPWNQQLLVGTTEVAESGDPGEVQPSDEERLYLLDSLRRCFPRAGISAEQVRYAYAGVRPLPFSDRDELSAITRRHVLRDHREDGAAHMLSVIGGKLTTAASLARECARRLGISVREPAGIMAVTGHRDTLGIEDWARSAATAAGIAPEAARAIAAWQGPNAENIVQSARTDERLREPLCAHTRHIVAEAVHAFTTERAVTLGDVLLRRVPVAFEACWSEECSASAARRIGKAVGWQEHEIARQQQTFEEERDAFLRRTAVATGAK